MSYRRSVGSGSVNWTGGWGAVLMGAEAGIMGGTNTRGGCSGWRGVSGRGVMGDVSVARSGSDLTRGPNE